MRQPAFIVATLTGSLLFGASIAGALRAPVGISGDVVHGAHASMRAFVESASQRERAAMLVAAIADQFPGHAVDVALEAPTLSDAAPEQQEVEAAARVRIDGSEPMPVRATALYDRQARSIASPTLRFEAAAGQPATEAMRGALAAAAIHRLEGEFAGQPVTLSLADAEAAAVGGRYLRLVARGTADFGAEGIKVESPGEVVAHVEQRSQPSSRIEFHRF